MGEILSHSLAAGAAFPFPLIFIASTSAGDLVIHGLDQDKDFRGIEDGMNTSLVYLIIISKLNNFFDRRRATLGSICNSCDVS